MVNKQKKNSSFGPKTKANVLLSTWDVHFLSGLVVKVVFKWFAASLT